MIKNQILKKNQHKLECIVEARVDITAGNLSCTCIYICAFGSGCKMYFSLKVAVERHFTDLVQPPL